MSSTDDLQAAAVFHAELLLPLQRANLRKGVRYLERGKPGASYWREVASRTGGVEELPGECDVGVLLGRLREYWVRRDEASLLVLLPYLERLQRELTAGGVDAGKGGGEEGVTEFVYPMF